VSPARTETFAPSLLGTETGGRAELGRGKEESREPQGMEVYREPGYREFTPEEDAHASDKTRNATRTVIHRISRSTQKTTERFRIFLGRARGKIAGGRG